MAGNRQTEKPYAARTSDPLRASESTEHGGGGKDRDACSANDAVLRDALECETPGDAASVQEHRREDDTERHLESRCRIRNLAAMRLAVEQRGDRHRSRPRAERNPRGKCNHRT